MDATYDLAGLSSGPVALTATLTLGADTIASAPATTALFTLNAPITAIVQEGGTLAVTYAIHPDTVTLAPQPVTFELRRVTDGSLLVSGSFPSAQFQPDGLGNLTATPTIPIPMGSVGIATLTTTVGVQSISALGVPTTELASASTSVSIQPAAGVPLLLTFITASGAHFAAGATATLEFTAQTQDPATTTAFYTIEDSATAPVASGSATLTVVDATHVHGAFTWAVPSGAAGGYLVKVLVQRGSGTAAEQVTGSLPITVDPVASVTLVISEAGPVMATAGQPSTVHFTIRNLSSLAGAALSAVFTDRVSGALVSASTIDPATLTKQVDALTGQFTFTFPPAAVAQVLDTNLAIALLINGGVVASAVVGVVIQPAPVPISASVIYAPAQVRAGDRASLTVGVAGVVVSQVSALSWSILGPAGTVATENISLTLLHAANSHLEATVQMNLSPAIPAGTYTLQVSMTTTDGQTFTASQPINVTEAVSLRFTSAPTQVQEGVSVTIQAVLRPRVEVGGGQWFFLNGLGLVVPGAPAGTLAPSDFVAITDTDGTPAWRVSVSVIILQGTVTSPTTVFFNLVVADTAGRVLASGQTGFTLTPAVPGPILASIAPPAQLPGFVLTLGGSSFSPSAGENTVTFARDGATVSATATSAAQDGTLLTVQVPPSVLPGQYEIAVVVGTLHSNSLPFTVLSLNSSITQTAAALSALASSSGVSPQARRAILAALDFLAGVNAAQAAFSAGQLELGFNRLRQAVQQLVVAGRAGTSTLALQIQIAQLAREVALVQVSAAHQSLGDTPDTLRAVGLLASGDAALSLQDTVGAVQSYRDAVQSLARVAVALHTLPRDQAPSVVLPFARGILHASDAINMRILNNQLRGSAARPWERLRFTLDGAGIPSDTTILVRLARGERPSRVIDALGPVLRSLDHLGRQTGIETRSIQAVLVQSLLSSTRVAQAQIVARAGQYDPGAVKMFGDANDAANKLSDDDEIAAWRILASTWQIIGWGNVFPCVCAIQILKTTPICVDPRPPGKTEESTITTSIVTTSPGLFFLQIRTPKGTRPVRRVVMEIRGSGVYPDKWDGRDDAGDPKANLVAKPLNDPYMVRAVFVCFGFPGDVSMDLDEVDVKDDTQLLVVPGHAVVCKGDPHQFDAFECQSAQPVTGQCVWFTMPPRLGTMGAPGLFTGTSDTGRSPLPPAWSISGQVVAKKGAKRGSARVTVVSGTMIVPSSARLCRGGMIDFDVMECDNPNSSSTLVVWSLNPAAARLGDIDPVSGIFSASASAPSGCGKVKATLAQRNLVLEAPIEVAEADTLHILPPSFLCAGEMGVIRVQAYCDAEPVPIPNVPLSMVIDSPGSALSLAGPELVTTGFSAVAEFEVLAGPNASPRLGDPTIRVAFRGLDHDCDETVDGVSTFPVIKITGIDVHSSDDKSWKVDPLGNPELDHVVTAKGSGRVVLRALIEPDDPDIDYRGALSWVSNAANLTSPAVGDDPRTVSLSRDLQQAKKIPVSIQVHGSARRNAIVWVVWAEISLGANNTRSAFVHDNPFDPTHFAVLKLFEQAYDYTQGASGPSDYVMQGRYEWVATISPPEVITGHDRPRLEAPLNDAERREVERLNDDAQPGQGFGRPTGRWDMTRALRMRAYVKTAGGFRVAQPNEMDANMRQRSPSYPSDNTYHADLYGNDDSGGGSEDSDPYNEIFGTTHDATAFGKLIAYDALDLGSVRMTQTLIDNLHFHLEMKEFVRLKPSPGAPWIRISGDSPVKLHTATRRNAGNARLYEFDDRWNDGRAYGGGTDNDFDVHEQ